MKTPFSFLLLFLFLLGFGQKIKDDSCSYYRKHLYELAEKVKKEKNQINYKKLIEIIDRDINKEKIKTENLVLIYNVDFNYYPRLADDEVIKNDCLLDEKFNCINFNQETFWTKNNIKFLSKYLNKNIILSNQNLTFTKSRHDEYKKDYYKKSFNKKNRHYVSLKRFFQKQKQGNYTLVTSVKKDEIDMCYLPYENSGNLHLIYDQTNNSKNFNTLKLEFFNYPNKIVKIGFVYNSDYENKIYKTYQCQNKNWVEIPTTDEYKF